MRAAAHARQLLRADHPLRLRRLRDVQAYYVGGLEQRIERGQRTGIAERQLRLHVVEDHLHAQGFGEHAELRPDMAVPHDAEAASARLAGAGGGLQPDPVLRHPAAVRNAAQQQDRLRQH